MNDEASPRPWQISDPFEDGFPVVRDMDGRQIATMDGETPFQNEANAALIVEAVNLHEVTRDDRHKLQEANEELFALRSERDRLRDIVRSLLVVRENVFWRKDEKTGLLFEDRAIDEEYARKTIAEARAAIGEEQP